MPRKRPELRDFRDQFGYIRWPYGPHGAQTRSQGLLDGNFARRKLPLKTSEYCIWNTELAGFGLRVRPSGNCFWIVRLRHRGKHRRITLGRSTDLDAALARSQARRLLAEAALDGFSKRVIVKSTPTMREFVATHFDDLARTWKPSTAKRNADAWKNGLVEHFGDILVADVSKADVVRWRDACAGEREARFNRAVPVLAALLKYAEALKMRRRGSNPCRGMPRYKRQAMERYLTPFEYARVGKELRGTGSGIPAAGRCRSAAALHGGAAQRDREAAMGLGQTAAPCPSGQHDRGKDHLVQQSGPCNSRRY